MIRILRTRSRRHDGQQSCYHSNHVTRACTVSTHSVLSLSYRFLYMVFLFVSPELFQAACIMFGQNSKLNQRCRLENWLLVASFLKIWKFYLFSAPMHHCCRISAIVIWTNGYVSHIFLQECLYVLYYYSSSATRKEYM